MKFRTELQLPPSPFHIKYDDRVCLLGSCFSENIGGKLTSYKYQAMVNPLGIMYHPYAIYNVIERALTEKWVTDSEMVRSPQELFVHWDAHSSLGSTSIDQAVQRINEALSDLRDELKTTKYLVLTYGTAYYYDHVTHGTVANCHKFPKVVFNKKLASIAELIKANNEVLQLLKIHNPDLSVILTVSPVRHIKDGMIENNRSKAHLLSAVHDACENHDFAHYFPSYELVIDDLRDYRYYTEDLVHPSSQAVDYIWHKLEDNILDPGEVNARNRINKLVQAAHHRPFNPDSESHQKFCKKQLSEIEEINKLFPQLNFDQEAIAFKK